MNNDIDYGDITKNMFYKNFNFLRKNVIKFICVGRSI